MAESDKIINTSQQTMDSSMFSNVMNIDDSDIENLSPFLTSLTKRSKRLEDSCPRIYEFAMTEEFCSENLRILTSGSMNEKKETKRLLMIGATGTGKTTLLNAMINHIFGVEYENAIRFKLIVDKGEEQAQSNQAFGQTTCVSVYKIGYQEGMKIDFNLILIDTPGFGDEGGIEHDKQIAKQIEHLFKDNNNDINTLNCVGFVIKSSSVRFTPSERYVFDSILRLFGKDMESNISMMITFVDSVNKKPEVLAALSESRVNYNKYFRFNNVCLFTPLTLPEETNTSDDMERELMNQLSLQDLDEKTWRMNNIGLKHFFNHVKSMNEKSLALTNEVIEIRNKLELDVTKIQQDIRRGVMKLNELEDHNTIVLTHQRDIELNKDFEYHVREIISVKKELPSGKYVTNCNTCKIVCHDNCSYSNENSTMHCVAMSHHSYPPRCRVCDNNCEHTHHSTDTFQYELQEMLVSKTSADLKARFDVAEDSLNQATAILMKLKDEFMNIQLDVMQKICDLKTAIDRLNEIALKPNPLSQIDYIDKLIISEEEDHKPGYRDRIKQLKDVREKIQFLIDIINAGNDPFDPYLKNLEEGIERKASQYRISDDFKSRLREICRGLKEQRQCQ